MKIEYFGDRLFKVTPWIAGLAIVLGGTGLSVALQRNELVSYAVVSLACGVTSFGCWLGTFVIRRRRSARLQKFLREHEA